MCSTDVIDISEYRHRRVLVKSALKNASDLVVRIVFQAIPPFEFAFKDERISLTIVDAVISPPSVPKGTICKELNVYPAECRGRRSTYRGRLTVSINDVRWLYCTILRLKLMSYKVIGKVCFLNVAT